MASRSSTITPWRSRRAKEQNLNDVFARLSALGIEVLSMRNKVNRLEEIFMRLVEKRDGGRSRERSAAPDGHGVSLMDAAVAPPINLGVIRWIGFKTIVIREYGRIIRIWGQTIVPSAVTATLYFVIFGSLIGRRVGAMGGFDYMQYIAPGLIMMHVITNSYANVVSSFFGAKFGKHVEEMLVSPLPNWIIVVGLRRRRTGARSARRRRCDDRLAAVHAPARASPLHYRGGGAAHLDGVFAWAAS